MARGFDHRADALMVVGSIGLRGFGRDAGGLGMDTMVIAAGAVWSARRPAAGKETLIQERPLFDLVYTRDAHPPDHCSFTENGGVWPVHCVKGTEGFEFHPRLPILEGSEIVDKATESGQDAYSGFQGTKLASLLEERQIHRCAVAGLATDYCVKQTVLDALKHGLETWVLTDAIAAVNASPGDDTRAILEMRKAGAELSESGRMLTVFQHHPEPSALIIVDVQNDFCDGGALAVPGSDRILGTLEKLLLYVRDHR